MTRTRPRRAGKLAAVLALGAGLFASGCGQIHPGTAALVGDQRITVDELSESVKDTAQAAEKRGLQITDRSRLVRAVLSREILSALLDMAAQREGITVTRGEVDRKIEQLGGRQRLEQQLMRRAVPPEGTRQWVRDHIIQQRLAREMSEGGGPRAQQQAFSKYVQKLSRQMEITVSPRYGHFEARRLSVMPEKSNLSTPDTDQPSPAPSEPAGSGAGG